MAEEIRLKEIEEIYKTPIERRKTDAELMELVKDLLGGRIYTDRHIPKDSGVDTGQVFMALNFMSHEDREAWLKEQPMLIYEDISKQGHRSINGCPIFMSFKFLNKEDNVVFWKMHDKAKAALDDALKTEETTN